MKRPRIITAAIEISSADVKVRVEVKSNKPIVKQEVTIITPNESMLGKCYFTWIINNERISK